MQRCNPEFEKILVNPSGDGLVDGMKNTFPKQILSPLSAVALIFSNISQISASPLIVAHWGASADAPENTLSAIKLAWEQGADAVEFDLHLSKDNRVVVFHDKDLSRYTKQKTSWPKKTMRICKRWTWAPSTVPSMPEKKCPA